MPTYVILLSAICSAIVAAASVLTALANLRLRYRIAAVRERSRTERLTMALTGSTPAERPEILRAYGELEGREPGRESQDMRSTEHE